MMIASVILMALAGQTSAAVPVPPPVQTANSHEKKICRRTHETGSLIKGKQVCMTRVQWERTYEDQSAQARQMVLDNAGRPARN